MTNLTTTEALKAYAPLFIAGYSEDCESAGRYFTIRTQQLRGILDAHAQALVRLERAKEVLRFYAAQEHIQGEGGEDDPTFDFVGVNCRGGYPIYAESGAKAEALLKELGE